jgi:hypothetical protein
MTPLPQIDTVLAPVYRTHLMVSLWTESWKSTQSEGRSEATPSSRPLSEDRNEVATVARASEGQRVNLGWMGAREDGSGIEW